MSYMVQRDWVESGNVLYMYTGYLVDHRDSHAGQGIMTANLDNPQFY